MGVQSSYSSFYDEHRPRDSSRHSFLSNRAIMYHHKTGHQGAHAEGYRLGRCLGHGFDAFGHCIQRYRDLPFVALTLNYVSYANHKSQRRDGVLD